MAENADTAPIATVAIVTKDRRETLLDAVASAVDQAGDVEVLVVDDGSTDGTAEAVRTRFPQVRVERFDASRGLVVRRNDAARLARGRVVVSIDDDAVLTSPGVVAQAVADLDAPGVGAVAIPYVDVLHGPDEHQRAPDADAVWVTAVYRGTAHAVDREAFLALGGYREAIVHQGEEHDLGLRLLASGRVVRLGRGDPIHHFESPHRSTERMDVYGRRNELLLCFTYHPLPLALASMAAYAAKGMVLGVRVGRPRVMARGIRLGLQACWALRRERAPLPLRVLRADRRLRRAGAVRLEDLWPAS